MKKKRMDFGETKKLRWLSIAVLLVLLAACALVVRSTVALNQRYQELIEYTEEYIDWQQKASTVHEASDYLTEQARMFVQTQNRIYMDRYFEEVNVTQRREMVMDSLSKYYSHHAVTSYLEEAVEESRHLMEQEYYAMRLVCTAVKFEEETLPVEIQQTRLLPEDAALSAGEMLEKGHTLMYDQAYQVSKAMIYDGINQFAQGALTAVKARQQESEEKLTGAIRMQWGILWAQLALVLVVVLVLLRRVKEREAALDHLIQSRRKGQAWADKEGIK